MEREHGWSSPPPIPSRTTLPSFGRGIGIATVFALLAIGLVVVLPGWVWFFWRIEPGADELAVMIHKTGANLPSGEILALQPEQKGVQLAVLSPGRYFKNPYTWDWEIVQVTDIPAGKLGVRTRLFGKDLPPGQIIAGADTKGILLDVLGPGKHFINPYAYQVQIFDAINIRPGCVGVVTHLVGKDPLSDGLAPEQRNTFIVGPTLKGVQTEVLDPGTHYLNPYMVNVNEVNLQSQRFELSGEDAINFLTMDAFTVHVEGTLEFAVMRDHAALLTHQVGEMDDILKKVILPRARGFSRIEGSKNPALNYIVGEMRQQFQNNLEAHLRETCKASGVAIRSVLIRNITVPDQIASIIREREVAKQTAKMYDQQIEQAKSKAELTKQEMLAQQNQEKVRAETLQLQATILAKQEQQVKLTAAQQGLAVAKLENDAAEAQAAAVIAEAGGEQTVVKLNNEAEAKVFASQALAFGSGLNYARYLFYQKVGPRIETILANDQAEGLGGLFLPYLPAAAQKEAGK
ncbi:MAG: SPFH domain-containing protein [Candidatus Paceibacterota bacterium]|jgi:regulator of protease activity HflC (stomatin/prohibitin superfamily)